MKVIVFANVQWPRFGIDAGGSLHAFEVARLLAKDHDVTVVVPSFVAAAVQGRYPDLQLRVLRVPLAILGSTIAVQLWSAFDWLAMLSEVRAADAVYAASHFLGDVLPLVSRNGKSSVVVIHHLVEPPQRRAGSFAINALHYLAERIGVRIVATYATSVLTSSELVAQQLRSEGLSGPIRVTVNAPRDLDAVGAAPTPAVARGSVLYLGRLSPTKGVDTLLRAWRRVIARDPAASLTVVGGGAPFYLARLERLRLELGLVDSVRFLGRVDDVEKDRLLRSHRVFAFPSREEGFGIVLVEAMRAAMPCVTFDLPIFRELFPRGRIGVPLDDDAAFADALLALLTDDSLREKTSAQALAMASCYTWPRAADIAQEALGVQPI